MDNSNFIIDNYIEEEIVEIIPETKNKSVRRSLFDDFDNDEEIILI